MLRIVRMDVADLGHELTLRFHGQQNYHGLGTSRDPGNFDFVPIGPVIGVTLITYQDTQGIVLV